MKIQPNVDCYCCSNDMERKKWKHMEKKFELISSMMERLGVSPRLFVLQCLIILFLYPIPFSITFIFAEFGLLNSSSKQLSSTPVFNPQDSICGICTKYKLDAFILDTKHYFFHILLKNASSYNFEANHFRCMF